MKVRTHIYTSTILGGTIYALTKSKWIAFSALVGGVLIDLDHLFDFLVFSGEKFSIKSFFSYFEDLRWEKVSILFHSYELFLLLSIIACFYPHDILVGILLGGGLHLLLDQIGVLTFDFRFNVKPTAMYYFLTYRCAVGFNKDQLFVRQQYKNKKGDL